MSSKSEGNFVRIKEHIPYGGKGVDELVVALRKILGDNKFTQKVVLEVGAPHIYIEKLVPSTEVKENEAINTSIHDAIRNVRMEEHDSDGQEPMQQLFEIFQLIQKEGLDVCHIAVGDKAKFQKWLGVRIPQTNLNVFGVPLSITGEIPDDVFVICGGPTRTSDIFEIRFAVKGTL